MDDSASKMDASESQSVAPVDQEAWSRDVMGRAFTEAKIAANIDRNSSNYRRIRDISQDIRRWIDDQGGNMDETTWQKMENVTADGKVKKRVMYPGSAVPRMGTFVAWQYTCFVEPNFNEPIDATRFSDRREILRVEEADENNAIQRGLRLGVAGMRLGENSHFRIDPSYAFGELGVPPRIPANAVLHYIVEMQDDEIDDRKASTRFLRQPVDIQADLGFDVCYRAAQEFREKGVTNFKKRSWEFARDNFKDGLQAIHVCFDLANKSKVTEVYIDEGMDILRETLIMNTSVVNAKLGNWEEALEAAGTVTESNAQHAKAHYYAALASYQLKNFEEAMEFCRKGIKLASTSPEMTELYGKLVGQQKKDLEKERLMCRRIFAHAQPEVKKDEFALVGQDVRAHTAEQIKKMKDSGKLVEVPMNYVFFSDKLSLRYLEKEAASAGLVAEVKEGKSRKIIRLRRA
ncbi:hypothetical protein RvY_05091 [Ramazzottius varieornatus]|uniref:peptidylprolyl isomerase n=1 Tax=Ramazzottius varieornatus TaxID=947166 RepID=A0A1D1UTV6_RAMVA|nr:hypothetical protein RvY_05091 [Ramazzottius varieornatus]